ncbi:DUF2235 domain-containing protein [Mycolicibacterium wolinskyi]|uniref:T6SS Phospholipase effector Tle1-like catalytic domain-containing protein n=1 Tax=Mycolicibacterium wolinskyi TaxID=59750 RepID=A0A1X2F865_9MYCO|nr:MULTISPECIES: DUF2235 domain-containing protein [Mycolicibacterium]MCV7286693.1 DUF2235 domain-containing protein [Mycolicibacterium wolinskyi]MCV7293673.1 DUF2235 domain-containing protein [Mycolicibacterium goodii]ORX14606.1 hypothetical protein AWC31_25830 [Mycolicibacterium wolinskyi]
MNQPAGEGTSRIVICLDGTANQIGAGNPSNVAKLFAMLNKDNPDTQLAYYDPGVGTLAPAAALTPARRTVSLLYTRAVGSGLKANVAEAYQYLMHHWRPGDAIYVFGFSRGAYTARALAGMLLRPGLLRPGSDNLVPYAVEKYAINRDFKDDEYAQWARFAEAFCWATDNEPLFSDIKHNNPRQVWRYAVPVAYMGLWDTVKAAGFLRFGNLRWPYTRTVPNVARIRHAVSIDERRRPYREYLVDNHPNGLEEQWFAGVHADVGGTFEPDHELATIALKWVTDGAIPALDIDPERYAEYCTVDQDFATGTIHDNGLLWLLAGSRRRPLPPDGILHPSVLCRMQDDPTYLPDRPRLSIGPPDWTIPRL